MTTDMSATFGSADLTSKAEAMLGSMEQAETGTPPESVSQQPPAESPAVTATPETPTFNDDTLVSVKIDGVEQQVPFKELKNGYSRESVFTQRMQTVAQQRQQLEQYFAEQQAQVIQAQRVVELAREELQRSNPLQQLLQQSQQSQKAPKNPNEIATLGEIEEAQQQLIQQIQQARQQDAQALQQAIQQAQYQQQQDFEIRQEQARFSNALNKVLESEEGKLLAELNPRAESIIRFETFQMGPQSTDEAIQFMNSFVNDWSTKVKGRVQTTSAVAKAKTVMEPPSGAPAPTIQQPKVQILKKDGGVNYEALRARALSLLD